MKRFYVPCALLAALGCMPEPEKDDNGDWSWVQQTVPELLGRKVRGWEETDVLTQAVEQFGRKTVADAIMLDPGFVDHWTDQMTDALEVQRGGLRGADQECWSAPMVQGPDGPVDDDGALAWYLSAHYAKTSGPIGAGGYPAPAGYNMVDVLRSSLARDDLRPVLRANLFPMGMNPGREFLDRDEKRQVIGERFDHTYLGRRTECMGCHSESFSLSDKPGWKRTWAPAPTLEPQAIPSGAKAAHAAA